MLLRILMNIGNHIPKLTVISNQHSPKRMFKQTARARIGFVDTLCIRVEEIGKTPACVINRDYRPSRFSRLTFISVSKVVLLDLTLVRGRNL